YVASHYLDYIDTFPLEQQYRLLHDLPDSHFIGPEVKRQISYYGKSASTALAHACLYMKLPWSPNSLPRELSDALSLIYFDHWDQINEGLRRQGTDAIQR
ncbi:hypothetical protein EJ02DRAFT_352829, partial [Clathrospora elynae]